MRFRTVDRSSGKRRCPVLPGDTPERLQKRVMEEAEWIILPEATEEIAARLLAEA